MIGTNVGKSGRRERVGGFGGILMAFDMKKGEVDRDLRKKRFNVE